MPCSLAAYDSVGPDSAIATDTAINVFFHDRSLLTISLSVDVEMVFSRSL